MVLQVTDLRVQRRTPRRRWMLATAALDVPKSLLELIDEHDVLVQKSIYHH